MWGNIKLKTLLYQPHRMVYAPAKVVKEWHLTQLDNIIYSICVCVCGTLRQDARVCNTKLNKRKIQEALCKLLLFYCMSDEKKLIWCYDCCIRESVI